MAPVNEVCFKLCMLADVPHIVRAEFGGLQFARFAATDVL
jgi:hypothetical protein